MTEHPARICILGGGFGGLYTALRLSQFPWEIQHRPEIILVDRNDRFLFSPLLYELVTSELQSWEIAPPYTELLAGTGIQFCQSVIAGIDLQTQQVQLQDERFLSYTRLVLALGGEPCLDRVPGVAEYALPFQTIADAYRLEEQLRLVENSDADKIRIAVVGGGYSGVELICKLADRLQERGRLRLVERNDQILKSSPEFNREAARRSLADRGIWIDLETTVARIEKDTLSLSYRDQVDTIPVDLVFWTAGIQMNELVRSLPLQHNPQGKISIDSFLQAIEHPEIFALGDLADCRDANDYVVPATAQSAFQQADCAGWNIWASLTNRPLLPFRYQHLGEMLALGVDNATLAGLGLQLNGPLAYVMRRLAYLYRLPTLNHQLKVGLNWMAQPLFSMLATNR